MAYIDRHLKGSYSTTVRCTSQGRHRTFSMPSKIVSHCGNNPSTSSRSNYLSPLNCQRKRSKIISTSFNFHWLLFMVSYNFNEKVLLVTCGMLAGISLSKAWQTESHGANEKKFPFESLRLTSGIKERIDLVPRSLVFGRDFAPPKNRRPAREMQCTPTY